MEALTQTRETHQHVQLQTWFALQLSDDSSAWSCGWWGGCVKDIGSANAVLALSVMDPRRNQNNPRKKETKQEGIQKARGKSIENVKIKKKKKWRTSQPLFFEADTQAPPFLLRIAALAPPPERPFSKWPPYPLTGEKSSYWLPSCRPISVGHCQRLGMTSCLLIASA